MPKLPKNIVLASGNTGKIKEFQNILTHTTLLPQSQFNAVEAEENGLSFVENAIIKARNAAKFANLPAIADDSGLVVEALGGKPGIHSARYSGKSSADNSDEENIDEANIDVLLKNMENVENRAACFYCAIVFVADEFDPTPIIATARWCGEILTSRRGTNGFGYDSVFYIPELNKSSAQLSSIEKNNISHRAQALQVLLNKI